LLDRRYIYDLNLYLEGLTINSENILISGSL